MSDEKKPHVRPSLNNPVVRSGAKIPLYPAGDRVVVERLDIEEEQAGGLIIPAGDKDANLYATVIAAGPLAMDMLRDACVAIGDTVCIGKYSGIKWNWRQPGTLKYESVDIINCKDIYGSVELADKIMSGAIGIDLHLEADGVYRHRFFEEQPPDADDDPAVINGSRAWRGGKCVCNEGSDVYHAHHDERPHMCAKCVCMEWRQAKKEAA